ncbi:MAG TPA: hypothetical protein DDW49_10770 [Deltaproteobacteria bacterium]|nr:MAG: hypothetical protein A2048_07090 [Deltaproteobacteria bacterium GWA2_45_12]HBF13846.1 hypothetical protein [Deltaproteobacteria bacterium]
MLFSWDAKKAESNIKKHHVSFEMAQTVFDDPLHLSVLDKKSGDQERWITMGHTPHGKTLIVVHTYIEITNGEELIRIISARLATRREIEQYEKGI